MKYFMLDIETLGIDMDKNDIIQIGILELHKEGPYYKPGKSYQQILNTEQEVTDPWILKNHSELIPLARATEYEAPSITRAKILNFIRNCGVTDQFYIMGLNATSFDVPFCVKKGILDKKDFHYRIYELRGAYALAMDVMGLEGKDFFRAANDACPWIELPKGKKHDALYDCYAQLKTLNGIIRLLKR